MRQPPRIGEIGRLAAFVLPTLRLNCRALLALFAGIRFTGLIAFLLCWCHLDQLHQVVTGPTGG